MKLLMIPGGRVYDGMKEGGLREKGKRKGVDDG